jgi:hypothetical protein
VVELTHDSRPIIGRGPPLGATFLTLALASVALMVADQRYDQIERVRSWITATVYPAQAAVDAPFRAWDWISGSFAGCGSPTCSCRDLQRWRKKTAACATCARVRPASPSGCSSRRS